MKIVRRHDWDLSPAQAVALQDQLRHEVVPVNRLGDVRTVAGIDMGLDGDKAGR
jgi:deoxyribonuclease V